MFGIRFAAWVVCCLCVATIEPVIAAEAVRAPESEIVRTQGSRSTRSRTRRKTPSSQSRRTQKTSPRKTKSGPIPSIPAVDPAVVIGAY